ncbi:hypothetical protein BJX70DRAFT_403454 [Aspergillus crustosus]
MASSHDTDDTFLHWLLYSSWHWALFFIYITWYEQSFVLGLSPPSQTTSTTTHAHRNHNNSQSNDPTFWLKNQGYLCSATSTRYLLVIHVIILILEPVEGYWILTGWYRLFQPAYAMKIPAHFTWVDRLAVY